jgi:hypothetical protein
VTVCKHGGALGPDDCVHCTPAPRSPEAPRDARRWYIEARVGSENYRGDVVRFIVDRRGDPSLREGESSYVNRAAAEAFADALSRAESAEASLSALRGRVEGLAEEWEAEAERRQRDSDKAGPWQRHGLRLGASFERAHAEALRSALAGDAEVDSFRARVAALEAERDEARKAYAAAHEELRRTADMLAAARDVANRQRAAGEAADAESAREIEARIVRPLRSERDALAAALRIANKALVAHGAAPVAGAPTAAPAKEEP